jgi:uncharacterized protein
LLNLWEKKEIRMVEKNRINTFQERFIDLIPSVHKICRSHHVARLAIFGSAAAGEKEPNDVDLLVTFSSMEPVMYSREYFALIRDLEQLFDLPIDLVEEPVIRNPVFREIIRETSREIYVAA